jgi:hypothetical protein
VGCATIVLRVGVTMRALPDDWGAAKDMEAPRRVATMMARYMMVLVFIRMLL